MLNRFRLNFITNPRVRFFFLVPLDDVTIYKMIFIPIVAAVISSSMSILEYPLFCFVFSSPILVSL